VKGAKPEDRPYIESSIEQRAQTSDVADRLQIDIASLEKGTYLLLLRVEDLVTGTTAIEGKTFNVSE